MEGLRVPAVGIAQERVRFVEPGPQRPGAGLGDQAIAGKRSDKRLDRHQGLGPALVVGDAGEMPRVGDRGNDPERSRRVERARGKVAGEPLGAVGKGEGGAIGGRAVLGEGAVEGGRALRDLGSSRRCEHAGGCIEQEQVLVSKGGKAGRKRAPLLGPRKRLGAACIADRTVAAAAVEEDELRPGAVGAPPREQAELARRGQRLAHRPGPEAGEGGLAFAIVGILVVMLLERGEEIELEDEARVAGGHEPVAHELVGPVAPEVAVEAQAGAGDGIVGGKQAGPDVRAMARAHGGMARQPAGRAVGPGAGAAVAGLAPHPVLDPEPWPASRRRHEIGVAGKALGRLLGSGQAEPLRHAPAFRREQHPPGAGVRASGA